MAGKFGIGALIADTTKQGTAENDVKTEKPNDAKPEKQNSETTNEKATYYLPVDDIVSLNALQNKLHRERGKKPKLSALVSEALNDLFRKHNLPQEK
jgi:hypothetical protein